MKFLDKETRTLVERIRTLFKEQGITIVSILTAVGMAIYVLVEALFLLGGPSTSTSTSQSNRAKEVVGWLSQNFWALITGVRVLIYKYFMTKTRRR